MCGILAAYRQNGIASQLDKLSAGLYKIRHRGPDASGEWHDETTYLGHNRLSIIDLSEAANQPFKSSTHPARIILNGEIYNYRELKKQLPDISFRTGSDTEVLLEGYLKEGISFFQKNQGDVCFCHL